MVFLLFFYALIAPSPFWPAIGARGFVLLAIVLGMMLGIMLLTRRPVRPRLLIGVVVLFSLALVPAWYWSSMTLALYPIFFVSAVLLVAQSSGPERVRFVDWASRFMLVLLIGAVIGFLLAAGGATPLTTFNNTDGRANYVFYTTFTNVFEEGFIRPSGVYDEPGAFSFFICITAYLREASHKDRRLTFTLLMLGFITFSVTHLIFVATFLLGLKARSGKAMATILALVAVVTALLALGAGELIQNRLLSRLELTDEGTIAGDTRTLLLLNAVTVLAEEDHAALMGAASECSLDPAVCINRFGAIGENVLSPLVSQGLFISWPYYMFLLLGLLSLTRGRTGLLFFAVALLFVQRPYLLNLGYATVGVLALLLHRAQNDAVAGSRGSRSRSSRFRSSATVSANPAR